MQLLNHSVETCVFLLTTGIYKYIDLWMVNGLAGYLRNLKWIEVNVVCVCAVAVAQEHKRI